MAKKSRKQRKQEAAQQRQEIEQQNNQPDEGDDIDEAVASANEALATNQPLVSLAGAAPMIGFADDEDDEDVEDYPYPDEDDEDVLERATAAVKGRPSRRKKRSISKASPILEQQRNSDMDREKVMQKLANPTIHVTEEQMRAEYGYVLRDIRNMFVLAAVLIVVLILLAQFI